MHSNNSRLTTWSIRAIVLILAAGATLYAMRPLHSAPTAVPSAQPAVASVSAAAAPVAAVQTVASASTAAPEIKTVAASGAAQTLDFKKLEDLEQLNPNFATLTNPEYPAEVKQMAGKKVTMKGFMVPYTNGADMKSCLLMPTPVACFFCAMPSPTQVVLVRQAIDGEGPFIEDPIEVTGTLRLWQKDPGDPDLEGFLFTLDDAKVTKLDSLDSTPSQP